MELNMRCTNLGAVVVDPDGKIVVNVVTPDPATVLPPWRPQDIIDHYDMNILARKMRQCGWTVIAPVETVVPPEPETPVVPIPDGEAAVG